MSLSGLSTPGTPAACRGFRDAVASPPPGTSKVCHANYIRPRVFRSYRHRPALGMTLVELVVVLSLVGLVAAVTLPAIVTPSEPRGFGQVVRDGRALAVARAQSLRLTITATGAWSLVALDSILATGSVASWTLPVELELTPTGACLPRAELPASWRAWDAVQCEAHPR